jgi:hypothetical protein
MRRLGYLFTLVGFAGLLVAAGGNAASTPLSAHQPAGPQNDSPIFVDSGQLLGFAGSRRAALGDLNGDGHVDAFVPNNGGDEVWLNDGWGFFSSNGQSLGDRNTFAAALGDLNGNGCLDALVANTNGLNQVWLNNCSGQFTAGAAFESSMSYGVALGDVNGDGHLDAVFANIGPNTVWFGNGDGTFSDSEQSLQSFLESVDVALADLNGDGHLDVFFAQWFFAADTVCLNDAGNPGVFLTCTSLGADSSSYAMALGDLNSDGHVDAVVATSFDCPSPNTIWLNDGNGNFTASGQLGDACSESVALADVNGNGALDALLGSGQGVQVWLNDGSGVFAAGQTLAGLDWPDLALTDLDGDGDPDLFVTLFGANKVFFNQGRQKKAPIYRLPSSVQHMCKLLVAGLFPRRSRSSLKTSARSRRRASSLRARQASTTEPRASVRMRLWTNASAGSSATWHRSRAQRSLMGQSGPISMLRIPRRLFIARSGLAFP